MEMQFGMLSRVGPGNVLHPGDVDVPRKGHFLGCMADRKSL